MNRIEPHQVKRLLASVFVLLICHGALGEGQTPRLVATGPSGPTDRTELEAFIDGAMAALLESRKVPGATVSVVKDGELFFAKGYGYADVDGGKPVDPEKTLFRIASTSKLFTWTAVMQMAERGVVRLDEDINAYLDFEIPRDYPEPITLGHLLTHTAGFEDRYRGLFGDGIEDLVPLREVVANNLPARVFPPGQEAAYSNYGAALAGYIVERVSATPFEQYVEQNIFVPLGMTHSTFRQPVPPELAADLAVGYSHREGAFEAQEFEYDPAIADGAMSTSAVDMAHFMIAHLQNGLYGDRRILQEPTARMMHTRVFTHDPRIAGMAYGFYEIDINGQRAIGHGGDLFSFHTDLFLLPEQGVGFFASFNSDTGSEARDEITRLFLDRYYPASQPARLVPSEDFASRESRYTGYYRPNRYAHESLEKTALLALGDLKVTTTKDHHLSIEGWGQKAQIAEVEPLLFRVVSGDLSGGSEIIAFRENSVGDITHMFPAPEMALRKIPWYDTRRFHIGLLAVCSLVFVAALVRIYRRRRTFESRTSRSRWMNGLATAAAATNLTFSVGFSVMLIQALESALFPESLVYWLALPVVSTLLTACVMVLVAVAWKASDGTLSSRLFDTVFGLSALAYLWFLNYWNLLGWHI